MPKTTSSSVTGPRPKSSQLGGWLFITPLLVFHLGSFGLSCLWRGKNQSSNSPASLALPLAVTALSVVFLAFTFFQVNSLSQPTSALAADLSDISPPPRPELSLNLANQLTQYTTSPQLQALLNKNLSLLALQPTHQQLLLDTALIYYHLDNVENYEVYLEKAQQNQPNSPLFHFSTPSF